MKSQYFKFLLIELLLVIFSFFQFFVLKQYNIYLYILELLSIFVVIRFLYKFDKKKYYNQKESFLIIIIMCLLYYFITYLLGFFVGFVRTVYSTTFIGMFKNVFFSISFILILEFLREVLIEKVRYYKSLIFISCIVLTILELLFSLSLLQFYDRRATLELFMVFVTPCLFRNIFLTYSTYYFGVKGSIAYHLLMVTVNYIVPVFPNFSDYLNTILQIVHPILIILFTLDLHLIKKDQKDDSFSEIKKRKINSIIFTVCFIFLFTIIYLISDLGRFTILAVGSSSMEGSIDKGDVVFIDKSIKEYDVGDVIVFEYGGTIIIHRIVEIKGDNTHYYLTKGDANNAIDNWEISDKNIKGKCIFSIKYIGIPTVALSEFLNDN